MFEGTLLCGNEANAVGIFQSVAEPTMFYAGCVTCETMLKKVGNSEPQLWVCSSAGVGHVYTLRTYHLSSSMLFVTWLSSKTSESLFKQWVTEWLDVEPGNLEIDVEF